LKAPRGARWVASIATVPGLVERLTIRSTLLRHVYETSVINVLLSLASKEQGRTAQRLYARAQSAANALVRKGVDCSAPQAALAHAAVRAGQQDIEGALRLLGSAEQGFEAEGMQAHLAAARRTPRPVAGRRDRSITHPAG